jgi:pyridoxamine 5'-phosphate oxidase
MMGNHDYIRDLRKDYTQHALTEADVADSPFDQFSLWLDQALKAHVPEPNATTLSTVQDGRPSARVVLLRGLEGDGLLFFTNYTSRKGKEIARNPFACMTFFWPELERQLRVEGSIIKASEAVSDAYFFSRPRGNRLGAWASPQSEVIENREVIERLSTVFETQYPADTSIPRPPHWGGYVLVPDSFEFWQGRASRLHDRIRYRQENGNWVIERLAP